MPASSKLFICAPIVSYGVTPRTEQRIKVGRGRALAWNVSGSVTSVAALAAGLLTLTINYDFRLGNSATKFGSAVVSEGSEQFRRSMPEISKLSEEQVAPGGITTVHLRATPVTSLRNGIPTNYPEEGEGRDAKDGQRKWRPMKATLSEDRRLLSNSTELVDKPVGLSTGPEFQPETIALNSEAWAFDIGRNEPLELTEELVATDPIPVLQVSGTGHTGDGVMEESARRDYSKTLTILGTEKQKFASGNPIGPQQSPTLYFENAPSTEQASQQTMSISKTPEKLGPPKKGESLAGSVPSQQNTVERHEIPDDAIGSSVRGKIDVNGIHIEDGQVEAIRLGEIVSLLESKMERSEYLLLKSAQNSSQFITSHALEGAGLGVRYESETGEVVVFPLG